MIPAPAGVPYINKSTKKIYIQPEGEFAIMIRFKIGLVVSTLARTKGARLGLDTVDEVPYENYLRR